SISAAEFAIVTAGSAGFMLGLGLGGIDLSWVLVMLAGGSLAAPVAAWLTKHVPSRMLGSLIGGLIIVVNLRNLLYSDTAVSGLAPLILSAVVLVWTVAVAHSARAHVRERRAHVVP